MNLAKVRLNQVYTAHAIAAMVVGVLLVVTPHALVGNVMGKYSRLTHEVVRCYGCLTLSQGWMAYKTRLISDARVRRLQMESWAICYVFSGLCLLRAQFTAVTSHGLTGWLAILFCMCLGGIYFYFRFKVPLKAFELPSSLREAVL